MRMKPSLRSAYWLTTTLTCMLLSGCFEENIKTNQEFNRLTTDHSAASNIPDWVLSPPKDATHLYGIGSAPRHADLALSFNQAERDGNAQIAQQLRSQVSQTNTQDTQVVKQSGQDEQVRRMQQAYTQVTTAPLELTNSVNEARYATSDYVYALQSINRTHVISKLENSVVALDQRIKEQAKTLHKPLADTPRDQDWHVYMQLIPLFAQRKHIASQLAIYTTDGQPDLIQDPAIISLETRTNQVLRQFGFDASKTASASALAGALSTYGLTPKANSTFHLSSQNAQQVQHQQNRFYVFETGTLTLFGPDGSQLGAWTTTGRGIATNKAIAVQQAKLDWAHQAVNAMFDWLTQ